jgi:hypothetical protein
MADLDAVLVQQVFDVPQRKPEPDREHPGRADDLGARLEPAEGAGSGHGGTLVSPLPRRDQGCSDRTFGPSRRRQCIDHVRQTLGGEPLSAIGPKTMASERRACRTLGQHLSTRHKVPRGRPDEDRLTADIVEPATQYGRYGQGPVTALPNEAGWRVNHKRVERIWQREGLKVPPKQK